MLPISSSLNTKNWPLNTTQASSKIKLSQECVFFFSYLHKAILSNRAQSRSSSKKKKTTPLFTTPDWTPPITPVHKKIWGKHFYKKKDKKEAKDLLRVFKKASSSLRFRIKSPPSFSSSLLSWTLKTDHWTLLSWVVFYPENLLFWNPPQGKTAFFFFLFSFAKMCVKWSEAEFTNSYKKTIENMWVIISVFIHISGNQGGNTKEVNL